MKITKQFTGGKMDKDIDKRYLPKDQYRDLINGRVVGSSDSNSGVLENMMGMLQLEAIPTLPSDYNVIGLISQDDYLYYVATNLVKGVIQGSSGGSLIARYDKVNNTYQRIIDDNQLLADNDKILFPFDKDTLIMSMQVFKGMLIFCDKKYNEPFKIDIDKCIADNNHYLLPEDVLLIKKPASEPTVCGIEDSTLKSNFLKNEPYQFAIRYEYENGEKSAISSYSGTEVDIASESAGIDGAIGFIASIILDEGSLNLGRLVIASTTDGFEHINLNYIQQDNTGAYVVDIGISKDGSIVAIVTLGYVYLYDFSVIRTPVLIKKFNTPDDIGGSAIGVDMSADGTNILLAYGDYSDEDLHIFHISNPYNEDSTLEEVHSIESGDSIFGLGGGKICMSADGVNVYAGRSNRVELSRSFGNTGTWSRSIALVDAERNTEVSANREVHFITCSGNGQTVYVLCSDQYTGTPDLISIFKSSNYGGDWDEIFYDSAINKYPRGIDCSNDGMIVSFIAGSSYVDAGLADNKIYVSNNGGSSFSPRSSNALLYNLTSITVSTTGNYITAVGTSEGETKVVFHKSSNFGSTFESIEEVNYPAVESSQLAITSVNNEINVGSLNDIDNIYNELAISFNTGDKHVTSIEVLMRVVKTNTLYRIETLNKTIKGYGHNQNQTIKFRNNGNYVAIANEDKRKLYDNVPLCAGSFDITQNTIILANYEDGRSLTNPDGSVIIPVSTITSANNTIADNNKGLKTNSNCKYAIIYYDRFNRSSSGLELGTLSVPAAGDNPDNPVVTVSLTIGHLAPDWAVKYKIGRKLTPIKYDLVYGFDNAYVVDGEIYLEITSLVDVVPKDNDTLELFSEINTGSGDEPYVISQSKLSVPILRYIDETGSKVQTVAVELSDGTNTARVDSQSEDSFSAVPKGRYIVISSVDVDNYTNLNVAAETSRYLSSLFYITRNNNIEESSLIQEIPGEYEIDTETRYHLSPYGDQSEFVSAIIKLENDYDVIWGTTPPREMYKYNSSTSISNLGRPNAISDNFERVNRESSVIASETYVDDTGYNGLSSFNLSLIPYKDLEKKDGPIYMINTEDTNIEVYQKNKISKLLYKKKMITAAEGTDTITTSKDVWGDQIRSSQQYGMSHPESYAEWGGVRYYVDAEKGVVLRKSTDGQTEISAYGMLDFLHDTLRTNKDAVIQGYYDPRYNNYCIIIGSDKHEVFRETGNGWEFGSSYFPDKIINDGLDVYSVKDGKFYKHDCDSEHMNRFYGVTHPTEIQLYFNDAYEAVKSVSTLVVNGDIPDSIEITAEDQITTLVSSDFENTEGLWYAALNPNVGAGEYEFVGSLNANYMGKVLPLDNINPIFVHIGDNIFNNAPNLVLLGKCTKVNADSIEVDTTVNVSKGNIIVAQDTSSLNGDMMKGRVIGVKLTYNTSERIILNSIQIEIDESKQ